MGKKNKTPEHALRTVAKLAAQKRPAKRIYAAMRAYYRAAGLPIPKDLSTLMTKDGVNI